MVLRDAEYIGEMAFELAKIARTNSLATLSHLLDMAALEAAAICEALHVRAARPTKGRRKRPGIFESRCLICIGERKTPAMAWWRISYISRSSRPTIWPAMTTSSRCRARNKDGFSRKASSTVVLFPAPPFHRSLRPTGCHCAQSQ